MDGPVVGEKSLVACRVMLPLPLAVVRISLLREREPI
jgi:hypothetical protein